MSGDLWAVLAGLLSAGFLIGFEIRRRIRRRKEKEEMLSRYLGESREGSHDGN